MKRLTLTCAVLLVLSVTAAPAAAQTACNRACLTGFVDTYFKALAANDASAVPLAGWRARLQAVAFRALIPAPRPLADRP